MYNYIILITLLGVFTWLFLFFVPIDLWITSLFSGVRINLLDLVFMRIRKVPPKLIVRSLILASKAGIKDINSQILETHHLASGNLEHVIKALIISNKANLNLTFGQAAAINLAGRDVLEAVRISVAPYMIMVPAITGVSADGIQLIAIARVTVRTDISKLVGGAGESTIIARVGQGIISRIGEAKNYKEVLERPSDISKKVLSEGLDAGTSYEILSIDIAEISIGKNIGAILQTDQASADLKTAMAKAEKRRTMAVALEQEMMAKIQYAKSQLIAAESLLPMALSGAYKKGQLFANIS